MGCDIKRTHIQLEFPSTLIKDCTDLFVGQPPMTCLFYGALARIIVGRQEFHGLTHKGRRISCYYIM